MARINRSADDTPPTSRPVEKSTYDVRHHLDTSPLSRVNVPETHIRESAHDAKYSVDTTPTSRVSTPEPTKSAPAAPAENGGDSGN
jgi:hypothetical protein